ncbi:type I-E CRISPR-associated protein Cse1/CasA [Mesosutterella sp. AGMB02718]|uniref:Type I-E CRISPR-associated protein Cse1/CasA n=1 Tax=Mesosutterella faecium TaxID=2925194 RepID=A0ABT7IM43_9BURK|nr:type I-E CRISPR-associated protein Cse1/CasA [Mesosutterella sp. AGMB02718]MDL2058996.1 type I-E CRISPR-associated protein Cse1/CasA [Mesosutterella sp. AGMB02718]
MRNNFCLIDDPWIPTAYRGLVSLRDVFSDLSLKHLAGTPVENIALMKLLQAISQAAHTPANTEEWLLEGKHLDQFGENCLKYLNRWRDTFFLYGDRPFLQFPSVIKAAAKPVGVLIPEIAMGNNARLTQIQVDHPPHSDAEKALILIIQQSMALAGKRPDKTICLTPGYIKKSAKPGPGMDFMGALHSFCFGTSLLETIWLNTFTLEDIARLPQFPKGLGVPPWEKMPSGEDDSVAKDLKSSLMGRLVPLSRFCLFEKKDEVHFTEGIRYPGFKEAGFDPSMLTLKQPDGIKLRWTNPDRKPWRDLTAITSFLDSQSGHDTDCQQISVCLSKLGFSREEIGIWSGGLRVTNSTGEQKVSASNDSVESSVTIEPNEDWFNAYKVAMQDFEAMGKILYGCTNGYFKKLGIQDSSFAARAERNFWEKCDPLKQMIIDHCDDPDLLKEIKQRVSRFLMQSYNEACPSNTARQIVAWAQCRPNLSRFFK